MQYIGPGSAWVGKDARDSLGGGETGAPSATTHRSARRASGVGAFALATASLWSVAHNVALVYRFGGAGLPRATWLDLTGRASGTS